MEQPILKMSSRVVLAYTDTCAGIGKSKYLGSLKDMLRDLSSKTFIFFDTETTGLDQHLDQITELSAVAVHGPDFEIADKMQARAALSEVTLRRMEEQKALPPDPKKWTVERALALTKYNESTLEARPEEDVLREFKEFCTSHPAMIVGHNAEFDMRMVGTKIGKIPNQGVWDTMLFARFYFHPMLQVLENTGDETAKEILSGIRDAKGKPQATLGKVLQALGISIDGWHTALADVMSTVKAFQGILKYVQDHVNLADDPSYKAYQSKAFKRVLDFKRDKYRGNPGL